MSVWALGCPWGASWWVSPSFSFESQLLTVLDFTFFEILSFLYARVSMKKSNIFSFGWWVWSLYLERSLCCLFLCEDLIKSISRTAMTLETSKQVFQLVIFTRTKYLKPNGPKYITQAHYKWCIYMFSLLFFLFKTKNPKTSLGPNFQLKIWYFFLSVLFYFIYQFHLWLFSLIVCFCFACRQKKLWTREHILSQILSYL